MVTAEMAVALPALVLVLGAALTVQSVVATRARCLDAARAGARAAARGDSEPAIRAAVAATYPRVDAVTFRRSAALVQVVVSARPGGFVRIALPEVSASAVAAEEQ